MTISIDLAQVQLPADRSSKVAAVGVSSWDYSILARICALPRFVQSAAFKLRCPLLEEGGDALAIVMGEAEAAHFVALEV